MHQVVAWIGVCARGVCANGRTGTAIIAMLGALCAAVLLSWPAVAQAQSWQYVYDEVGRLKAAIAPNGDRADYEYDAVGNIVAIRRSGAGALNITEFTPQIGKSGTVVKVTGSGYSTTLASNVVKFNGVAATVTAATATELTVTAPATGSTGPISVTVGASTATTRESFVYSSTIVTGAPTISTAAPTCAVPGNTVALIGTNFDVAPGATRVELGNMVAPTAVTGPTALSFVVPLGGTSALRVVTALGISATSTQLFVPPTGTCADYEAPVRPVLNGAQATLNIASAGKKAVVLFSGNASAALSLQLSSLAPSVAGTALNYAIYNTANAVIASGSLSPSAMSIHVPLLPTTGTYAVVFSWNSAAVTGTAVFQLQSNATLSTTGTALNTSIANPGQSLRVTFNGTAGQDWTLYFSAVTLSGSNPYLNFNVYRADGTYLTSGSCYPSGYYCAVTAYGLPVTGTYTVVLVPYGSGVTGSATLQAWASSRVTGALTIGTANTYTSTVPGQVVQKTFSGTAGQQLGLSLSGFTTSVSGAQLYAIVLKPDGTQLTSAVVTAAQTTPTAYTLDLPVLPTTGTYTVQVLPYQNYYAGLTTTFSGQVLVAQDVAATLATDGTATNITLAQAGQQARLTFAGTAGQDWTLNLSAVTLSGSSPYLNYTVYRPDGTTQVIAGSSCNASGYYCTVEAYGLPVSGTYSIIVTPYPGASTGSFTMKSWASSRVTGALTIGTANTYTSTVPGQVVQKTFSGTAGQQLGLSLSGFTTSVSGAQLYAIVLKPDGTQLTSAVVTAAQTTPTAYTLDLPVLPTTGTYTVQVLPYQNYYAGLTTTFSGQVLVAQDVAATLATDGTATNITLAQAGQQARLTFAGTAGQDWTLNLSAVTLSGSSPYLNYTVYRPDGTTQVIAGSSCNASGYYCTVEAYGLPVSGTYSIIVTPYPGASTGSFTMKSWASSRVTGALTIGTANTYTSTVPGQVVQKTFSGTAGQQLGLSLSGFTTSVSGAQLYAIVLKPDGTQLTSAVVTAAQTTPTAYTLDLPVLPTTGTYTVQVLPYQNYYAGLTTTFSGQVLVAQDVAATLATDGTATNITLAQAGQQARLTFAGTAGQDWTLNLSAVTLSGSSPYLNYTVYRPDGTTQVIAGSSCNASGYYCTVDVYGLPVSGHVPIVYTPYPGASTGSFTLKAWASSRVTGALTIGTAST